VDPPAKALFDFWDQKLTRSRPLFRALARASLNKLVFFDAQALANLAWAFATAGNDAELFAAIAIAAEKKIEKFGPQNLSNIVWAFATAGLPATALFKAVEIRAMQKMHFFRPQQLSNTAWAFATAGVEASDLLPPCKGMLCRFCMRSYSKP
jgi:hypothetical protein